MDNIWLAAFYKHLLVFWTPATISLATDLSLKIIAEANILETGYGLAAKKWKVNNLRHLWVPLLRNLV